MAVIAIDFDGVIHDYEHPKEGMRMGPPFDGAREAIRGWLEAGHTVVIHSCLRPSVIRRWMEYYDIPFSYIWGESYNDIGKPVADVYIDDRALRFTGVWTDVFREEVKRCLS